MKVLTVRDLRKTYKSFTLKDVSFSLEAGGITGFIGRNGAGKTTTLKSLLNFVHPDAGEIRFFGTSFSENELRIKQRIGYASGGVDYYPKKKIRLITEVTKRFYDTWDDAAYGKYLGMFKLDEGKTPSELSAGMKVKYALILALSHNAEILILDEPTSGLDPVSREEILDVFRELAAKGITILFSTHITSDIEKCADMIVYIKNGEILADSDLRSYLGGFKALEFTSEQWAVADKRALIGTKKSKYGYSALARTADIIGVDATVGGANLETVMIHMEQGDLR